MSDSNNRMKIEAIHIFIEKYMSSVEMSTFESKNIDSRIESKGQLNVI